MDTNVYAARRRALMERIGSRAVAVVGGKKPSVRNGDVENRFRASSDLWFLTGFTEPEALAVLTPGREKQLTMFVLPRDPERETWTGRRHGVEGAQSRFGADQAFPVAEIAKELPKLLDGADEIQYLPGDDRAVDELILNTLVELRAGERRGMRAPTRIVDLRRTLHEIRLIKDDDALQKMRRAVEITHEAHTGAMRAARAGVSETEIEALIDYTFRKHGGLPGYGTIVGGGNNATILHYVDNCEPLRQGQLLLVDAGCEVDGFTADVTRTYPIGAGFSAAQKRAYQIVLDAEKRCIEAVRPGATIDGIHALAVEILTQGMVELGLLSGEPKQLIESMAYRKYYMHRTSHWLGMDVHDVGVYALDGQSRPLQPGMVLTVEPGLYVPLEDTSAPESLRGIGIRIEDDVLVTSDAAGHEILTKSIPKEVADIEALTT
jgi:Xaa-Pro aminopeptidase